MKRRNNGRGEINTLQNHFTAYLTKRKYTEFKNAYLLYLESRV